MNAVLTETYSPRKTQFSQLVETEGWKVKVYTITKNESFSSPKTLQAVIDKVPSWVKGAQRSNLPTHHNAIVMVHEAREGVLILFSWWTGGEMIETEIYFADYAEPNRIIESPFGESALMCVWELEVFAHEKRAWINHVLMKPDSPNFLAYANDYFEN